MRHSRTRRKLWLEQGGDEESVIWQFHGAGFSLDPARANAQTGRLELPLILLIHAVIAVVLLRVILASANRTKKRSRQNLQTFLAGGFWAALMPIRQSARKRRDYIVL